MQTIVGYKHFNHSAQQSGMPAYWSVIEISNDRTPEFMSGSIEGEKIPRV